MRKQPGFTLIELLVVIAIIGILSTLVITQLGVARVKARNASAKSDTTEAGKAIETFKSNFTDQLLSQTPATSSTAKGCVAGNGNYDSITMTSTGNVSVSPASNLINSLFNGSTTGTTGTTGYSLKLSKTPGSGETYCYKATGGSSATNAPYTPATTAANAYVFGTTLEADASNPIGFYVTNGSTQDAAANTDIPAAQ